MIREAKIFFLVLIFLALQILILSRAQAEYRVFKLGVTYDASSQEQIVFTTLDNLQYETYYKITPNQVTRLIDHWMCHGRTDNFTPYCDKPMTPRVPAGNGAQTNSNQSPQTQAQSQSPSGAKTVPVGRN